MATEYSDPTGVERSTYSGEGLQKNWEDIPEADREKLVKLYGEPIEPGMEHLRVISYQSL